MCCVCLHLTSKTGSGLSPYSLRALSCLGDRVVCQRDFSEDSATYPVSHRLLHTPAKTMPPESDVGRWELEAAIPAAWTPPVAVLSGAGILSPSQVPGTEATLTG